MPGRSRRIAHLTTSAWRTALGHLQPFDAERARAVSARLDELAIPLGSLGRLHDIARQLAALGIPNPASLSRCSVIVFAADHGVARQGVSAFPQQVTRINCEQMLAGRATIAVFCQRLRATLTVVDVGVDGPPISVPSPLPKDIRFVAARAGQPSEDFTRGRAMTAADVEQAVETGFRIVAEEAANADILVLGEMGIGNSTVASAITCSLLGLEPEEAVGPGSGLDAAGIARKIAVVRLAIERARRDGLNPTDGLSVLEHLGGPEVCALVGGYIAAAAFRKPVVVDGFITMAAALIAQRLNPQVGIAQIWGSRATEPGAAHIQRSVAQDGLLDLRMRLGEGTAALLAVPIIRAAAGQLCEIGLLGELQ